jgi:hypothetical protein
MDKKRKCIQCEKEFVVSGTSQKYCLRKGCTPLPTMDIPLKIRRNMYKRRWKENNPNHQINYMKNKRKNPQYNKEQREYARERRKIPEVKEQINIRQREHYKNNKLAYKEIQLRYSKKYPEKKAAHRAARNIPLDKQCFHCGSTENLQKHHPDYSKPKYIITVCKSCHTKIHYEPTLIMEDKE